MLIRTAVEGPKVALYCALLNLSLAIIILGSLFILGGGGGWRVGEGILCPHLPLCVCFRDHVKLLITYVILQ